MLLNISCKKNEIVVKPVVVEYSFFIAGHVYGKPGVDNDGVHPPFRDKFPLIQNNDTIEFGVFLGDFVIAGNDENWNEIDTEIDSLGLTVHLVPGNHDIGDLEEYENHFGKSFYSFLHKNDLFITINPNIDKWNISGEQLDFLKNTVDSNYKNCNNIFVFTHQVLWWEPDNQFSNLQLNSLAGRGDTINFWSTIEPIFHNLPNNVVFCAGDIGALQAESYVYYNYNNITFIATGMGSNINDNFIIISIFNNKTIQYEIVALEGEEDRFGNLEDYVLP
jgi:hypothetical protein